jgi:hypothetical protein
MAYCLGCSYYIVAIASGLSNKLIRKWRAKAISVPVMALGV